MAKGLRIGETVDDINPKRYSKMKRFIELLNLLDKFCEEYNVPKKDIIIFGKAVLARNGIVDFTKEETIDICLPSIQFKKMANNPDLAFEKIRAGEEAVLTKGTLRFYSNDSMPIKYSSINKETILVHGFKCISIDTWKLLQEKSRDRKNLEYLDHPRLLK